MLYLMYISLYGRLCQIGTILSKYNAKYAQNINNLNKSEKFEMSLLLMLFYAFLGGLLT